MTESPQTQAVIDRLQLSPHPLEGGYFRRVYECNQAVETPSGHRPLATSIHYLLTHQQPIGFLHKNVSDILHFFHAGDPVLYHLLTPDGIYRQVLLGPDLQHHQLHLLVPGGTWKGSELTDGQYSLISEVVVPGFDYADNALATARDLDRESEAVKARLTALLAPEGPP